MELKEQHCYCSDNAAVTPRSPPQPTVTPSFGLNPPTPDHGAFDSALHELGMLSAVTDSRRSYLLEARLRRTDDQPTPWNSPTGMAPTGSAVPPSRNRCRLLQLEARYGRGVGGGPRRHHRQTLRQFHAPYVLPWTHDVKQLLSPPPPPSVSPPLYQMSSPSLGGYRSHDNSPEKPTAPAGVARSRSLDDIDFAKLRIAAAGAKVDVTSSERQPQDVDNMSHNFKQMHVRD